MQPTRTEAVTAVLEDIAEFKIELDQYYSDLEPQGIIDTLLTGKINSLLAFCQMLGWSELIPHLKNMTPLRGNAVVSLSTLQDFVIPEARILLAQGTKPAVIVSTRTEAIAAVLKDIAEFEINLDQYYSDLWPQGIIDILLTCKINSLLAFCETLGWSDLVAPLQAMTPLRGNAVESLSTLQDFVIPEARRLLATTDIETTRSPTMPAPAQPQTDVGCSPEKDIKHLALLDTILKKTPTTLEKWAKLHHIGRSTIYDWKRAQTSDMSVTGRVSDSKINAIKKAIEDDAKALGLLAQTASD